MVATLAVRRAEFRARMQSAQAKSVDVRRQKKALTVTVPLPVLFPELEQPALSNPIACRIVPAHELTPIQSAAWVRLWAYLLGGDVEDTAVSERVG